MFFFVTRYGSGVFFSLWEPQLVENTRTTWWDTCHVELCQVNSFSVTVPFFFQMRDTPCQEEMAWCWKFSEETTPMSPQQGIRFWYQGLEHKQLEWFMSTNLLYCSWTCMERTRHDTLKTAFPFTPLSFPHPDIQNGKAVVSMNPITWNYPPHPVINTHHFRIISTHFFRWPGIPTVPKPTHVSRWQHILGGVQ